MTKKTKQHYYLVAGSVTFRNPADDSIGSYPFNAVVQNDINAIPVRLIGKAQQALQMQFFRKMEDAELQVIDVHIISFTHLGWMTEAQFQGTTSSTELEPQASGAVQALAQNGN